MPKRFFNKRWIFFILVFTILIALGIWTVEEEIEASIAIIAVGVFLLLGNIILFPSNYMMDKNGIIVYFCFVIKISSSWGELNMMEEHCSKFFGFRDYHIGYFKTKFLFWEQVCIPKNRNTKYLLEKYYNKPIRKIG